MSATNGDSDGSKVPETADIKIEFNPTLQNCQVKYDPAEFKTFDFILAVLEMAKIQVTQMRAFAVAQQLQQQAMQQQEQVAIRNILRK